MSIFTFEDAHRLFTNRRKTYNRVKCHRYAYLMYDADKDEYTVNTIASRWRAVIDPITKDTHHEAIPRDEYVMREVARITREKVTIHNLHVKAAIEMWGVRVVKSSSILGNEYEAWRGAHHVPVDPKKPLEIVSDRMVSNTVAVKRVFDKTKQKETNALIARVRRWIVQREKLGAFKHLTDDLRETNNKFAKVYGSQREMASTAEKLMMLLNNVNPNDIKSFNALYYAVTPTRWKSGTGYVTPSFSAGFNLTVAGMREHLRRYNGEVEYVPDVSDV